MTERSQEQELQCSIWVITDYLLNYFVQKEQQKEIVPLIEEVLNEAGVKCYREFALPYGYAGEADNALNEVLSKIASLGLEYQTKKQNIFQKISGLVVEFKGTGGEG